MLSFVLVFLPKKDYEINKLFAKIYKKRKQNYENNKKQEGTTEEHQNE